MQVTERTCFCVSKALPVCGKLDHPVYYLQHAVPWNWSDTVVGTRGGDLKDPRLPPGWPPRLQKESSFTPSAPRGRACHPPWELGMWPWTLLQRPSQAVGLTRACLSGRGIALWMSSSMTLRALTCRCTESTLGMLMSFRDQWKLSHRQRCVVLCCAVLCCAVLCCAVLCCAVLKVGM